MIILAKHFKMNSLSAAEPQLIAGQTVETLKTMRSDEMFELFWKHVECLRVRTDTDEPTLPRKRRLPRRYELGDGESHHSNPVEVHYQQNYFEAIGLAVISIEDRFNQLGYLVYQNLEELLTKAANKEDYTIELQEVLPFYGDDFDTTELSTQLEVFSSGFTSQSKRVTIREIILFLQTFSVGQRAFYKQVCRIAHINLIMPVTNAASERSFSTMKRVKTYLRSTMGQERLNHLMALNIYKDEVQNLDLKIVANEYFRVNDHQMRVFG